MKIIASVTSGGPDNINGIWSPLKITIKGKPVYIHDEEDLYLYASTIFNGEWHIASGLNTGTVFYRAPESDQIPMGAGNFNYAGSGNHGLELQYGTYYYSDYGTRMCYF